MQYKIHRSAAVWFLAIGVALGAMERISFAGSAEPAPLVEGARKEGSLAIYSLLAVPDHLRIVNSFREKYPFIDVSLTRPGASERITARVTIEARAGRHLVDIVGVSRLNMSYLIRHGLMMSYESPERLRFDPAFKVIGLPSTSIQKLWLITPGWLLRARRRRRIKISWSHVGKGLWCWSKPPWSGSPR